uniref:probable G-protein coupled receptor 139 n=1 Tax=Pristiophorus japonicus TaxID=55135 RepID=UPI00398E5D0E
MDWNLRTIDWNVTTVDQNLRTIDWNVTTNLRTVDWNMTTVDQNLRTIDWNMTTVDRMFSWEIDILYRYYGVLSLEMRIKLAIQIIQHFYYPLLAAVGIPVNILTIGILSREKCGLSKCVTRYLVAMAVADLLVVILDLILRHIPIVYSEQFDFLWSFHVCNIHGFLLYAATDCSAWFTVTFTFDRFVAICCQKLKTKYCTERTAAVVLGTATVLNCLKDITWYFMLTGWYSLINSPWFCYAALEDSPVWLVIEILHYILNPCVPFVLILLLNALTVRYILVLSRARRRLRGPRHGDSPRDPEMESRWKSIILLLVISGNFILLWSVFLVFSIWNRMAWLGFQSVYLHLHVQEIGFMLQLLSCCTNTGIYAVSQTKFREQFKNVVKYPFTFFVKFIK